MEQDLSIAEVVAGVRRGQHQSLGALGSHLGYLGLGHVRNNLKKSPLIQSPGRQAGFGARLTSRTPNQLVVKYQKWRCSM